jgi:FKBP-type peptidyl-prolyl cis-trans isomerase SlyD
VTAESIAADKVVGVHYTLKNDGGEVIDSSSESEPLYYLHGHDNIVPGLERKLTGRAIGDKLQVTVQPADGYGTRDTRGEQKVPRDAFPKDVKLEVGMQLALRDEKGQVVPLWITKVENDVVHVDLNHPLAGEVLHFDVEIVSIRAATKDELTHGHPHGPDGHSGHHH